MTQQTSLYGEEAIQVSSNFCPCLVYFKNVILEAVQVTLDRCWWLQMPQKKTQGNQTKVAQCFNWLRDALQHSQIVAYVDISIIVQR